MLDILIIDDNEDVRNVLSENLKECGHAVSCAEDGLQGIQKIEKRTAPPDVVITDIVMPRREGIETIMEIRRRFPAIKLIAISGGGRSKTTDFLEIARKLGANGVIPKPVDMDELESMLKSFDKKAAQ